MSLRRGLWLFNNSLCLLLNHSIEFIVQKTQLLPTLVIRIYIALHSFLTFSSFICGTVFSSFNLFFWLSIVITSIGVQQPHKLCWLLVHVLFIGSNVTSWIKCIEFGLAKLCFQLQIKKFRKFVLFMSWCGFLTNNNKTSNKKCDTKICWVCMSCVCFFCSEKMKIEGCGDRIRHKLTNDCRIVSEKMLLEMRTEQLKCLRRSICSHCMRCVYAVALARLCERKHSYPCRQRWNYMRHICHANSSLYIYSQLSFSPVPCVYK